MYRPLDQVSPEMRFALRQFRRPNGLTLAAALDLACGIGGMTTVFTLVDAVVLRPLPVSAPGDLVWLRRGRPRDKGTSVGFTSCSAVT